MLKTVRPLRWTWAAGLAFSGLAAALGGAALLLPGTDGRLHATSVPELRLPMPPSESVAAPNSPGAPGNPTVGAPSSVLSAAGGFGPTRRIAAAGQRPLVSHARPFDRADGRPRIGLLVVGLGLQAELTEAAIRLPGEISLQFSVYASGLQGWLGRARSAGHEVLLDLPMEPQDYPASDPGPHTLLAGVPIDANLQRLEWVLARAAGYVALAGGGARFAASAAAAPVLEALARRGLGLIEIGHDDLASTASAAGLPYASAPAPVDQDPSIASIDAALAGLEADALRHGRALGVAQAYPVSLERLRLWAMTLADKGLVLAPVSALVIESAGLAAGSAADGQAGRGTQG
jgi:uncharacterized protein